MDFRKKNITSKGPLVTIGVLSYNYSRYLKDALDSLLTQTYSNIELIIVDDCSKDNSIEIINNWISDNDINCTVIQNKENTGITKVSNLIVRLAKGKYLNLFATDDVMLPEKIERQVAILEEAGDEYGMCYANAEKMDEDGVMHGRYSALEHKDFPEGDVLKKFLLRKVPFATPTGLIRTDVYKKTGLYDERVLIEDYNFWLRLFACYKVKYCSYPCLIYREKKESAIFNRWNENNKERYYHDRILSNVYGLKFIKDKTIAAMLKRKIYQYLKALYINNSKYANRLTYHCLSKGIFQLPYKNYIGMYLKQAKNIFTNKSFLLNQS